MSDELVKAEVLEVLRSMYPNTTIPEPDAFYFPRWLNDPLYRGSYSNWPSSFLRGHHTNLRATVEERLWFGGEATSFKFFGRSAGISLIPPPSPRGPGPLTRTGASRTATSCLGYLHGAYYEGLKVAEEIADCIEDGGCDGLPHVEEIPCSHPYFASDFI